MPKYIHICVTDTHKDIGFCQGFAELQYSVCRKHGVIPVLDRENDAQYTCHMTMVQTTLEITTV